MDELNHFKKTLQGWGDVARRLVGVCRRVGFASSIRERKNTHQGNFMLVNLIS